MKKVSVDLAERSYDIVIGAGALHQESERLASIIGQEQAFIITDENVAALHLKTLEAVLSSRSITYHVIVLPAGESTKTMRYYEQLMNDLLAYKPTRKSTLIALGGGVIGDITGFAAATLLRGVNFVQIPTTLLAMVDSSVGGKTGINSTYGKNLIGAFYQPKAVIADVDLLFTLPKRELLAGYAEVVKYAFINDVSFFDILEQYVNVWKNYKERVNDAELSEVLSLVVERSCQAKASIVAQDEREGDVRALLNLGHTFGHAIETELAYDGRVLHGEAVAIGMAMAFAFSASEGICKESDVQRAVVHMQKAGLYTDLHHIDYEFSADVLCAHMMGDKKNFQNKLVLILAKALGDSYIHRDVDVQKVEQFIASWLVT